MDIVTFCKIDDKWGIKIPISMPVNATDVIRVVKKGGDMSSVRLGSFIRSDVRYKYFMFKSIETAVKTYKTGYASYDSTYSKGDQYGGFDYDDKGYGYDYDGGYGYGGFGW